MYAIEIQCDEPYTVNEAALTAAISTVLQQHECAAGCALTVAVTSDEAVASLNQQFRGVDSATDILSFPSGTGSATVPGAAPYLGDLVIAYPYASQQAAHEGHVLDANFSLLVIHGTLHLLGYDHDTPENRADMWAAQDAALTVLGLPLSMVPALEQENDDE